MRRVVAFGIAFLLSSAAFAETITVAAAISLKDAMAHVAEQYKADTGEAIEFTFGSSGQLATQIQSGAPVDLFISAANKQVDDLVKAGVADVASRKVVAGNALVLVVPATTKTAPESTKALAADASITKIAIGEPKTVPAGQYAEKALKTAGVYDSVKDKLVFGTNVRQVLDYVERGEVSVGFVYATDAKSSGDKVRVAYTAGDAEHDPIVYPAVLISASKKQTVATKFLDYLLSEKGQAKLKDFGFTAPPQQAASVKKAA